MVIQDRESREGSSTSDFDAERADGLLICLN